MKDTPQAHDQPPDDRDPPQQLLSRFWRTASLFWRGKSRGADWALTGGLLLIIVLLVGAAYAMNLWNRAIFDGLQNKDAAAVARLSVIYFLLLEDKFVQRAVVTLLNAIYEEDFLGFSYGFRPGRGTHDALDALCVGIGRKKVSFVLDADIRSFFDEIDQQWSIRFLEHRISDKRIIRLVQVGTFPRATSTPTWAFRFAPYGTTRPLPRLLIRSGLGAQQRFRCHARAPELAQTDGPLPLAQGRSK